MLLVANLAKQNDAKIRKKDWNPGTWVLISEYSARAIEWILTWQGIDGFQKSLRPYALDKYSLSIGTVNLLKTPFASIICIWPMFFFIWQALRGVCWQLNCTQRMELYSKENMKYWYHWFFSGRTTLEKRCETNNLNHWLIQVVNVG